MALTDEQIQALLKPKRRGPSVNKTTTAPREKTVRFGRKTTQYPEPAPGSGVIRYATFPTARCQSYHCGAPSGHKYKGIAYCSIHLIALLTHELAVLSSKGENNKEVATHTADNVDTSIVVEPSSPGKEDWF